MILVGVDDTLAPDTVDGMGYYLYQANLVGGLPVL